MMKASVYGGRALNNFSWRVMDENLKDDGTRGDWNGISIVSIIVLFFLSLEEDSLIYDIHIFIFSSRFFKETMRDWIELEEKRFLVEDIVRFFSRKMGE